MSPSVVTLDGQSLSLANVVDVARNYAKVKLSVQAQKKVDATAQLVSQWVNSGKIIYGVTTGFGPFSEVIIPLEKARELQRNLLLSHATGVGSPFPTEVVRAAMLLRANTLTSGYSGIRLQTLELLISLLNKRVHPIIPEKGSVGASGDLAPLSHLALVLIGEGEAEYKGTVLSGAKALKKAELAPIELEQKEGIALINGTQITTAIAVLALADAKALVNSAEIAAALSIEALEGVLDAYDERIHQVRPHPGQIQSAKNLASLLKGSSLVITSKQRAEQATKAATRFHQTFPSTTPDQKTITTILEQAIHTVSAIDHQLPIETPASAAVLEKQRNQIKKHFQNIGVSSQAFEAAVEMVNTTSRVQDAYSLRCTPQVLGAARDAIEYVDNVLLIEINSATDNPLIFPESRTFLSGGNFHAQPIAIAMDLLGIAVTSIGSIAERRIARLIDDKLSNGLPLLLVHPQLAERGVHYGLGLAHITAAALTAECQTLTSPASVRTIPTSANQEDHVSMGTLAARHAREIVHNIEQIVAIEFLCAAQGVDIRKIHKPVILGKGSNIAFDLIRSHVPRTTKATESPRDRLHQDVLVHRDINILWDLVHQQTILKAVKQRVSGFTT
ncbi:MAG: histidine ammonia-lyase [Candidatus Hodarchaeota archaeon]